jgi:hypothetical protein
MPAEFFKGEDAVNFIPVLVKPGTSATAARVPSTKVPKDPVFSGVGHLLVVVVPDRFDEGEFRYGEFAGFRTSDIPPIGCIARSIKKLLKFLNRYIRLFQNCHKCPFLQLLMKRN